MTQALLSARQVYKTFTRPHNIDILKGVSLDVHAGESIAIMGASGEGKSTLLQILGTLEAPSSGELVIAGLSVSKTSLALLRNRHIGFIFQAFNLLEDLTVLQNVLMPALIGGLSICRDSSAHNRALQLLERVGLKERIHYRAKLLSGGEKQRVAIARALCNDPAIILADEPSGNLDHSTSSQIHALLMESVKEFHKALIVVTHDTNLASLCDQQRTLCNGRLT